MVVGGVPVPQNNNAERVAKAAIEMCAKPRQGWHSLDLPLSVPIGMATGEVVAGVIGRKKFIYDLWGDTVNVASGVESQGVGDRIQCTEEVGSLVANDFEFESRGQVDIKAKARCSRTS